MTHFFVIHDSRRICHYFHMNTIFFSFQNLNLQLNVKISYYYNMKGNFRYYSLTIIHVLTNRLMYYIFLRQILYYN